MNFDEIEKLLNKYYWSLDSQQPLNISSNDGKHHARNFAAEVTIEYFALIDQSNDEEAKEELTNQFKLIQENEESKLQTNN